MLLSPERHLVLFSCWLLFGTGLVGAQLGTMEIKLDEANRYITAARTEEALELLEEISDEIEGRSDPVANHFRLTTAFARTQALTRRRDYSAAARELLPLIDAAHEHKEFAIEARARIGMAYILHRQDSPEETMEYLNSAASIIDSNPELRVLSAELDNRLAAYELIYGDRKLSLRYANRALVSAREHHDNHQLALAHYLIAVLKQHEDPRGSEQNLSEAARYYYNTGSKVDYLVMTLALNKLQINGGRLTEAMAANDSAMVYAAQVQDRDSTYVSRVYDYRAQIMRELGRHDSAWHYLKMANHSRIEHLKRTNAERAVEVEALYDDEKNNLLLAEKDRMLADEERQRYLLLIFMVIGLIGFSILTYYFHRLRKAKIALEKQYLIEQRNEELKESLTQQKMLQGEVHHRVKNNLQIIISLLELQINELTDPDAKSSLEAMSGRIYSMAAVHETLYQEGRAGEIDFLKYAEKICHHFDALYVLPNGTDFDLDIKDYWFNLETAIPLGTMLNELLTNSFKYAALPDRPLRIKIQLSVVGDYLCLRYLDNGPGYPSGTLRDRIGGLGTYLLKGMSRQLRGRIESATEDGALTSIYFKRKNDYKRSRAGQQGYTNPEAAALN